MSSQQVDPAGNRLPYFDYATVEIVEDRQAVALGNVTGKFNMDAMWVGVQHLQLFTEASQEGRDIDLVFASTIGMVMYFNLDHEDPVKRAAFRDVSFRRAYSMAIDRDEIDNIMYSGLMSPHGTSFSPDTAWYDEKNTGCGRSSILRAPWPCWMKPGMSTWTATASAYSFGPPQVIRFYDEETGEFFLRPFVYRMEGERNRTTYQLEHAEDRTIRDPIDFFVEGDEYERLFGLIKTNIHPFGTEEGHVYLLGADQRGRDLLSRIIYGRQVSLSVGVLGVGITIMGGAIIGTLSGYYGGWIDTLTQRLIEVIRSFPQLPMWMALAAAIPPTWPPEYAHLGLVIVLGFINWTGLAREVRGQVLSIKQRDFVLAAEAPGASTWRLVFKHMIPTVASHVIVTATLAIPVTILIAVITFNFLVVACHFADELTLQPFQ